jgi:lipoyl(octanoyl) transferase
MPMTALSLPTLQLSPGAIDFHDLGRMNYARALEIQRDVQRQVIEARVSGGGAEGAMAVLLVEHDPPVITVSRRPGASTHLIASESQLRAAGVTVAQTDRGGDITYHGPGQIVVYPILDLNILNLRLNGYLRFLEQVVIDTLSHFGIEGYRDPAATGVWVRDTFTHEGAQADDAHPLQRVGVNHQHSKIAAIGVRVSRWVTMHGLALNVSTNLDHFNLIVPCGLAGRTVTSVQRLLGSKCPSMAAVKSRLTDVFRREIAGAMDSARGYGR